MALLIKLDKGKAWVATISDGTSLIEGRTAIIVKWEECGGESAEYVEFLEQENREMKERIRAAYSALESESVRPT